MHISYVNAYGLVCKCITKYFDSSRWISIAVADLLGGTPSPKIANFYVNYQARIQDFFRGGGGGLDFVKKIPP